MKIRDIISLGLQGIKKHKFNFILNCIVIILIMLIIFFCINLIASVKETAIIDLHKHLLSQNNTINLIVYSQNPNDFIEPNDLSIINDKFNGYGVVDIEYTYLQCDDDVKIAQAMFQITISDNIDKKFFNLYYDVKTLQKEMRALNSNYMIESVTLIDIEKIMVYSGLYMMIGIFIICYLTVLLTIILRNHVLINIYNEIELYSILCCFGMRIKQILDIAVIESMLIIVIGVIGGAIINLFLEAKTAYFANLLTQEFLYDSSTHAFSNIWFAPLIYCCVIIGFSYLYFYLFLRKKLSRNNLLKTLSRNY